MQAYSLSQQKLIDIPDAGGVSTTQPQLPSTPSATQPDQSSQLPAIDSSSGVPGNITGHSLQEHQAALQKAMAAGDKVQTKNITDQYNMEFQYQKDLRSQLANEKKASVLSSPDKLRHDALQTALSSLDAAETNLVAAGGAKGPFLGGASTLPIIGQYTNPQGAAYHATKIELATQLAKAITGGSRAPQTVIEQYLHSLPDVNETPAFAADKIAKIRSELMTQAKSFKFNDILDSYKGSNIQPNGGEDQTSKGAGQPVSDAISSFANGPAKQLAQTFLPHVIKASQMALQGIGSGKSPQMTLPEIGASALGPLGEITMGSPRQKEGSLAGMDVLTAANLAKGAGKLGSGIINGVSTLPEMIKAGGLMKYQGALRTAAAEQAGNLNTKSLLDAGEKYATDIAPRTQPIWEAEKPALKDITSAHDLLDKMAVWGKAYKQAGAFGATVKDKVEAGLYDHLYKEGTKILQDQAPEVAKRTEAMAQMFGIPSKISAVQKALWLAAKVKFLGM